MRNLAKKTHIPNILLFGAPGVGKGTYGSMLTTDIIFKKISTGDEIRSFLKKGDLSGEMLEIQKTFETGGLVDDQMIMKIITKNLSGMLNYNGVLFDGFPRNRTQAELFSESIDTSLSYVVNFTLDERVLIEKMLGRRICEDCGEGYNYCSINHDGYDMAPLLPKNGHSCDKCGGKLIKREDDVEEVMRDRLSLYHKETEPILEIFEKLQIPILNFEAKKGKKDYPKLLVKIKEGFLDRLGLEVSEKAKL